MKTTRIYQPGQFETGTTLTLDKAASNHLVRVLRLKNGHNFTLFNGEGGEYHCSLEINGKTASASINSFSDIDNESPLKIHLLQGISKGDRMDFAIQKSVELGVHSITPVICERTVVNLKAERMEKKLQHWQAVAISACEQSGRNRVPTVNPASKFSDVLDLDTHSLRITLDPLSAQPLKSLQPGDSNCVTLLIGPEGGLSDSELEQAKQKGFEGASMGPRILRTETAALAAITAVQQLWGDFS